MKENVKKTLEKGKWLGNTLITILLIAVIVVLVITLNIFIEKSNLPKIDLTKEKLYSLSEESKSKINSVQNDTKITLYSMSSYPEALDYAKLYQKQNAHITYEELNEVASRPDLQQKYGLGTTITSGVIIVESGNRSKIVSIDDLYVFDYTTYEQFDVTEQTMTNAILDVNLEKHPKIYFVTNHSEIANYFQISKSLLKNEANDVEDLDLLVEGKIPEDCNVLVLTTISEDFSEYERDIVLSYINNGGNLMILIDPDTTNQSFPNFQAILDMYGTSICNGILYEQNSSNMIQGYTNIIIPNVSQTSEITKNIFTDGRITVLASGILDFKNVEELEALGISREDIITTTSTTFLRNDTSIEEHTITEADLIVPDKTIASILTKKISDEKTSKLVICACSMLISDMAVPLNNASANSSSNSQIYAINFYNNKDFLINSISYLSGRDDNITVRKNTGVATYTATVKEDEIIRIIITALPIVIILTGIVVWQVRRRKNK